MTARPGCSLETPVSNQATLGCRQGRQENSQARQGSSQETSASNQEKSASSPGRQENILRLVMPLDWQRAKHTGRPRGCRHPESCGPE